MKNSLLEKIYDATDAGREIIYYYYPQAKDTEGKQRFFKIRGNEKTASASMKQLNGIWKVTDFGDDGTAMAPIEICMREENLEFREALYRLAERYEVSEKLSFTVNKPAIEQREATLEEKEGAFSYKLKEKFSEFELKVLGHMVKQETCDKYSYFSVESYTKTKDRKTTTISSTETYPIFMRNCGEFRKIYQPLNPDKAFRFFYDGVKPKNYINGMDELKRAYEKYLKEIEKEEDDEFDEEKTPDTKKERKPKKLPEAIFCSGERDALNVAGMGYLPLWLNSETAKLDSYQYSEILKRVERIYNIPDIDETGVKKGNELALEYIDIFTIELPENLRTYKDMRGKPRKDLRDFVELYPNIFDFKELIRMAKPCKFWEKSYSKEGVKWEINTVYMLHFLKVNGFGKITDVESGKVTFIKITGYTVEEITGKQIRGFILKFLEDRKVDHDIQNLILNSKRTGVSVMDDLEDLLPDFTDYSAENQIFFFKNKAITIYSDKIEENRGNETGVYAWQKKVSPHYFKRIEPAFMAKYDNETECINFEIKHKKSHLFRFLINASRIYWHEEFETRAEKDIQANDEFLKQYKFAIASPRLSEEENQEQLEHLINKVFTIGYLLHRYKSPSRAWGVWVMENKLSEEDESAGGSGKSFLFEFLKNLKNMVSLPGRNQKLTENQHVMDRVDEHTDILLIDDAYKYFDFNFFYSMITGSMNINEKNVKSKEIDFGKSAKIAVTSNFPPHDKDSSTMRRILFCVFSDYYHKATDENKYSVDMRIADDFGYDLYNEKYTEEWWNEDFNFCVDCIQFYLSTIKDNLMIQPPMQNVIKRMNIQQMGEQFREWAEVYFNKNSENVDCLIYKAQCIEEFIRSTNLKGWSSSKFTKALKAFVANTDYIECLNPLELRNDPLRIMKKIDGKTVEMYYLKTYGTEVHSDL